MPREANGRAAAAVEFYRESMRTLADPWGGKKWANRLWFLLGTMGGANPRAADCHGVTIGGSGLARTLTPAQGCPNRVVAKQAKVRRCQSPT